MADGNERFEGGGSVATGEPDILTAGETDAAADIKATIERESATLAALMNMGQQAVRKLLSEDRPLTEEEQDQVDAMAFAIGKGVITLGLHPETVAKKIGQPYDYLPDDFEFPGSVEKLSGVEMMQRVSGLFRPEPVLDLRRVIPDASRRPGMAEFLDTGGFDAVGDREGIKVGDPGFDVSDRTFDGVSPPPYVPALGTGRNWQQIKEDGLKARQELG